MEWSDKNGKKSVHMDHGLCWQQDIIHWGPSELLDNVALVSVHFMHHKFIDTFEIDYVVSSQWSRHSTCSRGTNAFCIAHCV